MPELDNPLFTGAAGYWYGHEWSVIPVEEKGKKPLVDWKAYQEARCEEGDLTAWWSRWPRANVGVITGKVSGITVVDVDSKEGLRAIEPYVKNIKTPTAKTQKGGRHLYFRHVPGLSNSVRRLTGVDLRNDGGFVVAPPSAGVWGRYEWIAGSEVGMVAIAEMPEPLIEVFKNPPPGESKDGEARVVDDAAFQTGKRNDTLFHYALALARGGKTDERTLMSMLRPINRLCAPPLPEPDLLTIVRSALKHDQKSDRVWPTEIKDWVGFTGGKDFHVASLYGDLGARDISEKTAIRVAVNRLVEGGFLEPSGRRHGWYRRIMDTKVPIDLTGASTAPLPFKLPLGIDQYVNLYPGNIVVVAGEQDVGKTAFMIEAVRLNQDNYDIDYYSSEMGDSEFRMRLTLNDTMSLSDWKFNPFEHGSNFHDVIQPNRVSIVDFMEITDDFWKVAGFLSKIHEKLGGTGLALVALQKGKGKDFGRGGDFGMEKPRLYMTMSRTPDFSGGVAQLVKAKNWKTGTNPNGMMRPFNVVGGHRFVTSHPWMSVREYDVMFDTENGKPKIKGSKKLF